MKNVIKLMFLLLSSAFYAQAKCNKNLSKATEDLLNLYILDTIKTPFQKGDYVVVYLYKNLNSSLISLSIDISKKNEKIYINEAYYNSFNFKDKKIVIFCDLNSSKKCTNYFKKLKLERISDKSIDIAEEINTLEEIDDGVKPWTVFFNENQKIIKISGKIIEAEIRNPVGFKKFLQKFSNLQLYQMDENGMIVYPEPPNR